MFLLKLYSRWLCNRSFSLGLYWFTEVHLKLNRTSTKKAPSQMFDWVLNMHLMFLFILTLNSWTNWIQIPVRVIWVQVYLIVRLTWLIATDIIATGFIEYTCEEKVSLIHLTHHYQNWSYFKQRTFRSSPSEKFFRKSFLKICRKFTGEHPCIFSEHLFIRTPLEGCFLLSIHCYRIR